MPLGRDNDGRHTVEQSRLVNRCSACHPAAGCTRPIRMEARAYRRRVPMRPGRPPWSPASRSRCPRQASSPPHSCRRRGEVTPALQDRVREGHILAGTDRSARAVCAMLQNASCGTTVDSGGASATVSPARYSVSASSPPRRPPRRTAPSRRQRGPGAAAAAYGPSRAR